MAIKKAPPPKKLAASKTVSMPRKRLNTLCFRCGEMYPTSSPKGNFAKVRSTFYEQNDGYLHVCNKCMAQLFEHYKSIYEGNIQQVIYTLCLNFNIYYSNDILDVASKSPKFDDNPFGTYMSRANMSQYMRWRDFTDTIDQNAVISGLISAKPQEVVEASIAQNEKPSSEILGRWGTGYSNDEYAFMQTLYKSLMQQKRNPTPLQEDLIVDACKYKCQHNRFISAGDSKAADIKTLSSLYQEALKAVGLDVSPKNDGVDEGTFGLWIRDIEKYCPAEDYKDKKKYRDMDGLGEYVERFIYRPLKNWLTGSKDKDPEYTIGGDTVV